VHGDVLFGVLVVAFILSLVVMVPGRVDRTTMQLTDVPCWCSTRIVMWPAINVALAFAFILGFFLLAVYLFIS
jgi:hypothetical protein